VSSVFIGWVCVSARLAVWLLYVVVAVRLLVVLFLAPAVPPPASHRLCAGDALQAKAVAVW
jgi:hypothetical protein